MRSIAAILFVATYVVAVCSASIKVDVTAGGDGVSKHTIRMPRPHFHHLHGKSPSAARRPGATSGSGGSGSATDPPVEQPHKMIVALSNYCPDWLNNSAPFTYMFQGGGGFITPVDQALSTYATGGFIVEADPGSDIINGTALYYSSTYPIYLDFFAVQGEWGFEASYPTAAAIEIQPAVVGRMAVYNIVVGHPHNATQAC